MAYFDWKPQYSVGHADIDRQHQELVKQVNVLYDALSAGKGREVLGDVLNSLVGYTVNHFSFEEGVMKKAGYPDLAVHMEKHKKMKAKVGALVGEFKDGTLTNPIQITSFLKDWLKKHILETDMAYSPFLKG